MQSHCGIYEQDVDEPMATACEYRDGMPCEPCTELAEIEAELSLHSQQKVLRERHRQARVRRNHVHSPLIHRFPPEIVAFIFTLAFPPRDMCPCCNPTKRASPLKITSVCHTWRLIALSMPRLWCDISVDYDNPNFPLLDHHVAHSGMQPLSLYLFAIFDHPSTHHCVAVMSFVLKQLYRTVSLCINLPSSFTWAFSVMPDSDFPETAPLLEELHLHFLDHGDFSPIRFAIYPPSPRRVRLDYIPQDIIDLDWTIVSSLTLKHSPATSLLPELLASDYLEQLVLWLTRGKLPMPHALIVNRSIQDLTLATYECAVLLLSITSLPSLQKLTIRVKEISSICLLLCNFLHRSQCRLQVLSISSRPSNDGVGAIQVIIDVLENIDTTMLHQLTIRLYGRFPSSNFKSLIQRLWPRARGFLPRLQTLSLSGRYLAPPNLNLLLELMTPDDHSSEITNGPNTYSPLRELILGLPLALNEVDAISRDVLLRILQLRGTGKTISIRCSPTWDFLDPEASTDLVEHWTNTHRNVDQ